jgi:hypothetical protein
LLGTRSVVAPHALGGVDDPSLDEAAVDQSVQDGRHGGDVDELGHDRLEVGGPVDVALGHSETHHLHRGLAGVVRLPRMGLEQVQDLPLGRVAVFPRVEQLAVDRHGRR